MSKIFRNWQQQFITPQEKKEYMKEYEPAYKRRKKLMKSVPPRAMNLKTPQWKKYRKEKLERTKRRLLCRFSPNFQLSQEEMNFELDDEDRKIESMIMKCCHLSRGESEKVYSEYVESGKIEFPNNNAEVVVERDFGEELTQEDLADEDLYRDYIMTEEEVTMRERNNKLKENQNAGRVLLEKQNEVTQNKE